MPFIKISVKGRIDQSLSEWFQGYLVSPLESEETVITGEAMDNSAVYGLLSTLSTLGITLISVTYNDSKQ
jgi:hypothetical protein